MKGTSNPLACSYAKTNHTSYIDELAAENKRLREQLSQSPGFLTPREEQRLEQCMFRTQDSR
jgi:hypothetical protein